jgi:hypothetical protein
MDPRFGTAAVGAGCVAFNVTVSCLSVTARQERRSTKPSRIRKAVIVCGISRVWSWVVTGFLSLLFYFNNTLFSQGRNDSFLNNEDAKMTQAYYIYIMVLLPLLLYSCVFMFMLVGWDSISELVSQSFTPRCIWVWRLLWNDIVRVTPKSSEKNLTHCHFVHHKSHMD